MWKRGHDPATLEPQRHQPPAGWDAATFERVTDALAAVLIAAYRRRLEADRERGRPPVPPEPRAERLGRTEAGGTTSPCDPSAGGGG
jgi:hypothetical protein